MGVFVAFNNFVFIFFHVAVQIFIIGTEADGNMHIITASLLKKYHLETYRIRWLDCIVEWQTIVSFFLTLAVHKSKLGAKDRCLWFSELDCVLTMVLQL